MDQKLQHIYHLMEEAMEKTFPQKVTFPKLGGLTSTLGSCCESRETSLSPQDHEP